MTTQIKDAVIGVWYCGFVIDGFIDAKTGDTFDADGIIVKYEGDGEFYADGDDTAHDMGDYDYLIAQE